VQSKSHWDVKIFVQVGTVQSAKVALEQGVDVLVVQGVDAGGHQWAQGASLMSLLPEVRDLVSKSARVDNVAILAAGGIVDGRGCVAALGLGELHVSRTMRMVDSNLNRCRWHCYGDEGTHTVSGSIIMKMLTVYSLLQPRNAQLLFL
jgi:hypothetical protein